MTSVGDYLKKEREARQLSVQEVAELTKISERYLACIECGDYDQLPPGPYAKGYIAAYARQVCGDEAQALELYSAYRTAVTGSTADSPLEENAPSGELVDFPRPNGNGGTKWQTKLANGLSRARSLRQALPESGNLKHLSNGGAKEKPSLSSLIRPLLALVTKTTVALSRFPKALLLKGGLVAGIFLVCATVLVFAGFGVYHLFIFEGPSEVQVAATPSEAVESASDLLRVATSKANAGPKAAQAPATAPEKTPQPTPSKQAKAIPEKGADSSGGEGHVTIPDPAIVQPADSKPAPPATAIAKKPGSPEAPEKKTRRSTKPQKQETLAEASPQPSAPQDFPMQANPVAPVGDIPVTLIKASVCTAIEERMPAGVGDAFPWTTHKIYVWSLLSANDPPAKVRHIYYHDGRMVSDVTLTVGSSHWRTWSFHTLSGQLHIGSWHIDVATMDGRVMRRLHFEIQ